MSATVLIGHEAEWAFTLIASSLALIAAIYGWRRHRLWTAASALSLGALLLILVRVMEEDVPHELGLAMSFLAGGFLVSGHLMNI